MDGIESDTKSSHSSWLPSLISYEQSLSRLWQHMYLFVPVTLFLVISAGVIYDGSFIRLTDFLNSTPLSSCGTNSFTTVVKQVEEDNNSSEALPYPFGRKSTDPGDNLQSSVICGTWQAEYSKLHSEIVEENKKTGRGRLLIFTDCRNEIKCGGIGDHLVGTSTALMLAIVFKRAMFVDWPALEDTEAFLPSSFDWRFKTINPNDENTVITNSSCDVSPFASDSFELDFVNPPNEDGPELLVACLAKLNSASTIRLHLNRGFTFWGATQPPSSLVGKAMLKYGLKPAFVAGCFLRNLVKPNPRVLSRVQSTLDQLRSTNKLKICIHSRYRLVPDPEFTGEAVDMDHYMNDTNTLLSCANTLYEYWGQESVGTLWFFMSGSPEVNKRAKNLFPDRIIESGVPPMHTDYYPNASLSLETTMAEWFLFTQCHFFVFHSSGMSKTAAAYALRPQSMYSFSQVEDSKLRTKCNPLVQSSPEELGTDWSGL